jgi:hypothetical protein
MLESGCLEAITSQWTLGSHFIGDWSLSSSGISDRSLDCGSVEEMGRCERPLHGSSSKNGSSGAVEGWSHVRRLPYDNWSWGGKTFLPAHDGIEAIFVRNVSHGAQ